MARPRSTAGGSRLTCASPLIFLMRISQATRPGLRLFSERLNLIIQRASEYRETDLHQRVEAPNLVVLDAVIRIRMPRARGLVAARRATLAFLRATPGLRGRIARRPRRQTSAISRQRFPPSGGFRIFGAMLDEIIQKLEGEVERLTHELNVTLPATIKAAVELGDLRENADYKSALERQQFVQARLNHLTSRLRELSNRPLDRQTLRFGPAVLDPTTRGFLYGATGTVRLVATEAEPSIAQMVAMMDGDVPFGSFSKRLTNTASASSSIALTCDERRARVPNSL